MSGFKGLDHNVSCLYQSPKYFLSIGFADIQGYTPLVVVIGKPEEALFRVRDVMIVWCNTRWATPRRFDLNNIGPDVAKSVEDLVSLSAFALGAEVFAPTETAMLTLQDQWASPVLTRCLQTISDCALHTPESANTYLRSLCHHFRDTVGIRGRQVMSPLRSALTGTLRGPCLGVVTSLLGASRCRSRIEEALACKQVS